MEEIKLLEKPLKLLLNKQDVLTIQDCDEHH